jgi:SAM-dependent methyltransferase
MENTDRQSLHFETIAKRYFSARHTANHLLYKQLLWRAVFKNFRIDDRPAIDVLEPMCGYAEGKSIIEGFYQGTIHYDGFDTSATMLEHAARLRPECTLFQADINQFVPNKKYDVIILIGGLHHIYRHAAAVLATLRNALKDSGVFINFEPTHSCALTRYVRNRIYKSNSFFDRDTEQGFTLDELNQAYSSSGLQVARQLYTGLLAYVLYYNPDAFPLLNIGGPLFVKSFFGLDKLFYRNRIGRLASFATLSILTPMQKN